MAVSVCRNCMNSIYKETSAELPETYQLTCWSVVAKNFLRFNSRSLSPKNKKRSKLSSSQRAVEKDVKDIERWIGRNLGKADE